MGETVGYVVLTKRIGVAEQWLCDHAGEPYTRVEAIVEAANFLRDNPEYTYELGAIVIGGES